MNIPANLPKSKSGRLSMVYDKIKNGKTPTDLISLFPERSVWRYIAELKLNGNIEKIGYVWKAIKRPATSDYGIPKKPYNRVKNIRGHNFTYIINIRKTDWEARRQFIKDQRAIKGGIRTIFLGRKVWLLKNKIIIYENKSFFDYSAAGSKNTAIYELQSFLTKLENHLKADLRINGQFRFKVSRQHFSRIRDALAIQCDREGNKIRIKLDEHGNWFVIDNSFQFHEAELQGQAAAKNQDEIYSNFIRSLFEAPFTAHDFKAVYGGIVAYTKQMHLHLAVEQRQLENQEETLKTLKKIQEAMKKFK